MRLIYISPVFWESYAQRPHFMVRHFLECGGSEVLWVNPYPGRLPRMRDLSRPKSLHDQGTSRDPRVQILNFRAFPIEPLPGGYPFNKMLFGRPTFKAIGEFAGRGEYILGIGKPCALAVELLRELNFSWSFYDAMDDFPLFHVGLSRASMARHEQSIGRQVSTVFVSSSGLGKKFADVPASVSCIPNAFDPTILPKKFNKQPKIEMVLGYVGSLGDWFDWDIVIKVASVLPSAEIRLIGPCLVPPPDNLPSNVKIFPPCAHSQVGNLILEFSACLIPFKKSPLTHGVDPIKFYEYRALGLPVLSTSFGEMSLRTDEIGVFFLDGPNGVQGAIKEASSYNADPELLKKWRDENSWSYRFSKAGLFFNFYPGLHH